MTNINYGSIPEVTAAQLDGSREAAAKALTAMEAAYHAASTPPVPELAPDTPAAAASRLAALRADRAWSDKLLRGDAPQVAEFHRLSEMVAKGDEITHVMAGSPGLSNLSVGGVPSPAATAREIQPLRDVGLSDAVIEELLRGHVATPEEVRAVSRLRAARHSDPQWVKAYLSGSAEHRREATLMAIVLGVQRAA
jgi:hypothetical protein